MPLVAHNELPTFQRLRERGQEILTLARAEQQDIRELHIDDAGCRAGRYRTAVHSFGG